MKYVLGFGSNCGDRLGFLRAGLRNVKTFARPLAVSRIYESAAMLPQGAPETWNKSFLNFAVRVESELAPLDLLSHLKSVEKTAGREGRERWSPRELDIDILTADETFSSASDLGNEPGLQIPHAGLRDRPFALLPLADVWPDWKTPWGRTAREEAAHWRWSSNPPFETKRTGYSLTELMGIVNITPDSFSDDGALKHDSIAPVSEIIAAHLNAGCTILDFGAESTRPGGVALTPQEEWARLEPVLKNLQPAPFKFSLDSRHSETVERALEFGLDWINDVTGFASLTMRDAAVRSGKTVVAMHSLTVPVRRDTVLSDDADPLELILRWGFEKIEELEKAGVARERIILDPGIGFGKTPRQNLYLLQNASRFHEWGVGVLVGHSRKSFMAELTGRPPLERDFETAMFSAKLAEAGIEYLRVHDSELNARAISAGGFLE